MSVLPVGIGSEEAAGGYQIERSLRFNSADSAYLSRTPASASNRKTWTWSGWVKLGALDSTRPLFAAYIGSGSTDNQFFSLFFDGGALRTSGYSTSYLVSTAVYRDPSAWYHIVCSVDTTSATANNRIRLYVNGIEVTVFSTRNNPTQNTDLGINQAAQHQIGQNAGFGAYFNGYLTEINFIDGSALDPTSFGEFNSDTGVWQPKAYTGTYGTNGFYLNFSDNASTTTLGDDFSGNNNDWTTNNFSVTAGAGNDSLVDSPTRYGTDTGAGGEVRGNYATLNPLWKGANITLANGNLDASATSLGSSQAAISSIFVSSGKWYFEYLQNADTNSNLCVGIADQSFNATNTYVGSTATTYGYIAKSNNKWNNGSFSSYGSGSASNGDVLMCAFDLDNGKIYFGKNGTWYGSGDPVAGTDAAFTGISGTYCPAYSHNSGSSQSTGASFNFGQRPFAYTAPSGFKALCTTNLPDPTIADGGEYFNTVLYSGTSANQSVSGVGFQPDFVWIKIRNQVSGFNWSHVLQDAVRGAGNTKLFSNSDDQEGLQGDYGHLSSFDSDGFSLTKTGTGSYDYAQTNRTGGSYVAWNWKANGSGVSNTAGTITSTVSVSTTSGFSIVTYAGNSTAGATIGHGLGVAPSMVIVKARDKTEDWLVYHKGVASDAETDYLQLNSTAAASDNSVVWNDTAPTSTVFTVGADSGVNGSTYNYVAYCFAPVAGYSAFGSYTGNLNADGPFVYTGFRPAFVMWKRSDGTGDWIIFDTARDTYNYADKQLIPNLSDAEQVTGGGFVRMDFLSNGFKVRSTDSYINANGGTYIYMAFSEVAFNYALGR